MPTRLNRRDRHRAEDDASRPKRPHAFPSVNETAEEIAFYIKRRTYPENPVCLVPGASENAYPTFAQAGLPFAKWNQHFEQLLANLYNVPHFMDLDDQEYYIFLRKDAKAVHEYTKASINVHTQLLVKLDGVHDELMQRWKRMSEEERRRILLPMLEVICREAEESRDHHDYRLTLPEVTLENLVRDGAVLVELLAQFRPIDLDWSKGLSNQLCPNDQFDRLFLLNKYDKTELPRQRGLRAYTEWARDMRLEGLVKFAVLVLNTLDGRERLGSAALKTLALQTRSPYSECASCRNSREQLLVCSPCRTVGRWTRYCSRDCQMKHLKLHRQVQQCGKTLIDINPSTPSSRGAKLRSLPALDDGSLRSLCLEAMRARPNDLLAIPIRDEYSLLVVRSPFEGTLGGRKKLEAVRSVVLSAFRTCNRSELGFIYLILWRYVRPDYGIRGATGIVFTKAFRHLFSDTEPEAMTSELLTWCSLAKLEVEDGRTWPHVAEAIEQLARTKLDTTVRWDRPPIRAELFQTIEQPESLLNSFRSHLDSSEDLWCLPIETDDGELHVLDFVSPFTPGSARFNLSHSVLRRLAYDVLAHQESFCVGILSHIIATTFPTMLDKPTIPSLRFCFGMRKDEDLISMMRHAREKLLSSTDHREGNGTIAWDIVAKVLRAVDSGRAGTDDDYLEFPPLVGKNAESNRKKKQRKKQARLELEADESEGVEQEGDKEEEELAKGMLATELEQRE